MLYYRHAPTTAPLAVANARGSLVISSSTVASDRCRPSATSARVKSVLAVVITHRTAPVMQFAKKQTARRR
jgi:hypothetical protein